MATKAHHQPELVGANQFLLMLDFLRNAETYAAKLLALENVRNEANKLIDAHVDLSEIDAMRTDALTDRTTAKKLLADSQARAEEMLNQAQAAAAEVRGSAESEARQLREDAKADIDKKLADARDALSRASTREEAAASAGAAAAAAQVAASKAAIAAREMEEAAIATRQKFELKYAALQGALQATE